MAYKILVYFEGDVVTVREMLLAQQLEQMKDIEISIGLTQTQIDFHEIHNPYLPKNFKVPSKLNGMDIYKIEKI